MECMGLHPLPVIFKSRIPVELHPGTNYEVHLEMEYIGMGVGDMETVWGGDGAEEVDGVRFTKVIRQGVTSSITCGQIPIIYYSC